MNHIGADPVRVTGQKKVTGEATFVSEYMTPATLHASLVEATIARGKVVAIDEAAALKSPGVRLILSYKNFPKLNKPTTKAGKLWEEELPFQSPQVDYDGQAVAVVVADTPQQAAEASRLVKVSYAKETAVVDLTKAGLKTAPKMFGAPININNGDATGVLSRADNKIEQEYEIPVVIHAQMELIASLADWKGDKLTLYQSTQAVQGTQHMVAEAFGLSPDKVRVVCPYVGGGFGIKGFLGPGAFWAAAASKKLKKPVLLEITRGEHFANAGHRGRTIQRIGVSADKDGKLTALRHHVDTETSYRAEFIETAGKPSTAMFGTPNLEVFHRVAEVNRATPCPTRGPGETPGTFALGSAMDELARKLGIDPVEFLLKNDTATDPSNGKPFSTRNFEECLRTGAKRFGWGKKPSSKGPVQVGHGVAAAVFPANRRSATVKVIMAESGPVVVQSATHDLGTGAYTVMAQVAAQTLGLPLEDVRFELGDSDLPTAPGNGGSWTSATVAPAVQMACVAAKEALIELAAKAWGTAPEGLTYSEGKVTGAGKKNDWRQLVKGAPLTVERSANTDDQSKDLAYYSFGAHFVEVTVDRDLGILKVERVVGVFDAGQILNPRTARSQLYGGTIYGLGMALSEAVYYNPDGRLAIRNFADYHVPVHADIPSLEVEFVGEPDLAFNPVGCRGLGEIGTTGIAAAVANAVFDATGVRVRKLPITLDKILELA